jgi:hypothetical protein
VEITEQDGLVIASVDREEAASGAWRSHRDGTGGAPDGAVDIVRLTDSEGVGDADLAALGFTVRPRWINWTAPVRGSEEEFTASLPATERRNIRRARDFVRDERLRVELSAGLTERVMDEFLDVYDAQIAAMPRGRNFARGRRDRLLAASADHLSVCVYDGTAMVAGSLWSVRAEPSVLQMRFSAAATDARSSRVLRTAYLAAFRFARESGLAHVSLGNDPSLFGHVVQPGLFAFKTRFGFTAVPSRALDPHLAGEYADRFLSLRSLSDPALVVTWGAHRAEPVNWPEVNASLGHDLLVLSAGPGPAALGGLRTDRFRQTRLLTLS